MWGVLSLYRVGIRKTGVYFRDLLWRFDFLRLAESTPSAANIIFWSAEIDPPSPSQGHSDLAQYSCDCNACHINNAGETCNDINCRAWGGSRFLLSVLRVVVNEFSRYCQVLLSSNCFDTIEHYGVLLV